MKSPSRLITFLLALLSANLSHAANILCLIGVASRSHQLWSNVLFEALAQRGHQLTVVSPDLPDAPVPNISHIHLEATYNIIGEHYAKYSMDSFEQPHAFRNVMWFYEYLMPTCKGILASEGFRETIELATKQHKQFDVIIVDTTNGPGCLVSLAHLFPRAPLVGLSAFGLSSDVFEIARGGLSNPATVPHFCGDYTAPMSYWRRIFNTALYGVSHLFKHFVVYPVQRGILAQNLLVQELQLPLDVEQIKERLKILLINTNPALDYAQLLPPNVVPVGGLQILEPRTLPADMLSFIEAAPKGVVYMSLGSNFRAEILGPERIEAMLQVMRRLSQYHFLWKMENVELIKQHPKNLFVSEWFPQNDVLAHKKVIGFFSHAGSLSIQEAVAHGVPLVMLPFMLDQPNNAQRITALGVGITMQFAAFNEVTLFDALTAILQQPQYQKRMQQLQIAFRLQPQHPLETAIWWVEQVLTQPQSFEHLVSQTGGDSLGYFATHSLDIIALVLGFFLVLILNCYLIFKQTIQNFKTVASKNQNEKSSKKAAKIEAKKVAKTETDGKTTKKTKVKKN